MSTSHAILDEITLSVYSDISMIETSWKQLEVSGVAMAFQKFEWCKAWIANLAPQIGATAVVLCGRDKAGNLMFVLPFQYRRVANMRILEWLCQQSGGSCGGLFDQSLCSVEGQTWFTKNIDAIFNLLAPVDATNLRHMPASLMGRKNPLIALHSSFAANSSFNLTLQAQYEAILKAKRSSRSISKMRRRDERLEESGSLKFEVLVGGDAAEALQDGLDHKNLQLRQIGVGGVFKESDVKFYQQIARAEPNLLRTFRLQLDEKTLVTMVGVMSGGRFWLLISALAPNIDLQFSPGDYLLRRTIVYCCEAGIDTYDFSLGEQSYKQLWADNLVEHYNFVVALSFRGALFAHGSRVLEFVKRHIKKNTHLNALYPNLRRRLHGSKP